MSELLKATKELAESLKPGQAVIVDDALLARSKGGQLRFAGWTGVSASWCRGDFDKLLAEHIDMSLDAAERGYFAGRSRRNIEFALARPCVLSIEGIGRTQPRLVPRA